MTNLNFDVCKSLDVVDVVHYQPTANNQQQQQQLQVVDEEDDAAGKKNFPAESSSSDLKDDDVVAAKQLQDENDDDHSIGIRPNSSYKKTDAYPTFSVYSALCMNLFRQFLGKFKSTSTYKIVFSTTQMAHLIMIIAITLVSALFFPFDPASTNTAPNTMITHVSRKPVTTRSTYLIYLTALSLHAGSQFWMTFVSGFSLYFNLARHAFGDVQKILFPKYFTMNCALSAVILIQFGRLHERQIIEGDVNTILQVAALSLCFLLELLIRLYLIPSVLRLMSLKNAIEKEAGIGQEVGRSELGSLTKCPHYMAIRTSFHRVHMYTAIGNMISMFCSAFHLYYLANKWTDHLVV